MIMPIEEMNVKVYNRDGSFCCMSNLMYISKNKLRSGKQDIRGVRVGSFDFKVTKYKDGYRRNCTPILYKDR